MSLKRDWATKWAIEIAGRPDLVDEIAAALRAERKASEKRGAADELEGILNYLLTDSTVMASGYAGAFVLAARPAFLRRIAELRNWREIEEGNQ